MLSAVTRYYLITFYIFFFPQNENLRSSRDAPHSSSMSDMAISPLSLFSPVSPTDSVFWDSVETPPKVSIIRLVSSSLLGHGADLMIGVNET